MRLFLECDADERLARLMGFTRRDIEHAGGKGAVCNGLLRNRGVLGMVDEDPNKSQPAYLSTCRLIGEQHRIRLLADEERGNRVVMLCPDLEGWLVEALKKQKIPHSKFGLPDNPEHVHGVINTRLKAVEDIVRALNEAGSKPLEYLQSLLKPT